MGFAVPYSYTYERVLHRTKIEELERLGLLKGRRGKRLKR